MKQVEIQAWISEPTPSALAPYGCEPRLPVARESRRAIVMPHLDEPGSAHVVAPDVEIEEAAIAVTAPAFLIVSSWV